MVKHKHQISNAVENNSIFSIVGNLLLFVLKMWAGLVSGSVSLIADAWHTLSDSISSVIVLIAIRVAKKPADDEHPFGHGRAELIASVIIGTLLAVVSLHFLSESISRLLNYKQAYYGTLAIVATASSIVLKEIMARLSIKIGKAKKSDALVADGWHHRSDALSSIVILIGIFLGNTYWWMDGLLGILVSIFIAAVAYSILKDAIHTLLGQDYPEELKIEVQEICNQMAGFDTQVHQMHVHEYGGHKELIFHIVLPGKWTLQQVHDLIDDMELQLEQQLDMVATIHVDPDKVIR